MNATAPIILLGSGGHAAHCAELAVACALGPITACLDDAPHRLNQEVLGIPISGPIGELGAVPAAASVVVALGDPVTRGRLIALAQIRGLALSRLVHPAACLAQSARLGEACVVDAGVVIGARARLGAGVIVDAGASIAHDAWVGGLVHVEAGARILPGARIGPSARIGANAVVMRNAEVAEGSFVPPGAVVEGALAVCTRQKPRTDPTRQPSQAN